ncbi:MAG: serine/threonine protein kinase [Luteolibacter sp.]
MSPVPFPVPGISHLAELFPAFEFEHLIAQGESGTVYKARQPALDRDVAIKILPRELGSDLSLRNSFQAEAKAMASLSHPNLIRVYDSGEVDGLLFMVMEYVPGKSLFNSAHGKAIDPKQAVRIALSVCRGLAHTHGNGIIHGDIRLAKILLNPECEPKIVSFGSVTGSLKSDIYAIGVMLRELLTGITEGTPGAEVPTVSDTRLAAICDDATHEDLDARYRNASALADQLERWLATGTSHILATPPRPAFTTPKTTPKRPVAAARPHRASSPV